MTAKQIGPLPDKIAGPIDALAAAIERLEKAIASWNAALLGKGI